MDGGGGRSAARETDRQHRQQSNRGEHVLATSGAIGEEEMEEDVGDVTLDSAMQGLHDTPSMHLHSRSAAFACLVHSNARA